MTHDAAIQQESVAKARRNPDCMAGRDVRHQNEAQTCEKTRFPKADTEDLNPSLIGGKGSAETTTQNREKRSCPGGGKHKLNVATLVGEQ